MEKNIFYKVHETQCIVLPVSNTNDAGSKIFPLNFNTISNEEEKKHTPFYKFKDNNMYVKISGIPHPMTPEHHIEWIYIQTKTGGVLKYLPLNEPAKAVFPIPADDVICVYSYCNLHGLWESEQPNHVE